MADVLPSWREGAARTAILDFVARVTDEGGPDFVPPAERVAVFDNDGTLWCEKPMPIELGFILERLAAMAEADAELAARQPWKAAHEQDYGWLGDAMVKHYRGDESDAKLLIAGVVRAFAGWSVEDYLEQAAAFLRAGRHPTLGHGFMACGYVPMVELLRHLDESGFAVYIASGGDRDFMRAITEEIYGIPPERVIGSSNALSYVDDGAAGGTGSIVYLSEPDIFDDGPVKPVRIWSRVGRRPIFAAGNSNGDVPTLRFAGGADRPALRLLVLHDDAEREFDYVAGAEKALAAARAEDWTVVSVKDDWATVFAESPPG